jgi:hypothetical protein
MALDKSIKAGLFILVTLTLTSASLIDKELKLVLRDGQFAKIPKKTENIKKEIVNAPNLRYGYLSFDSSPDNIEDWIQKSGLKLTSKEEVFTNNIMVDIRKRPEWFSRSGDQNKTGYIYYSKRQTDNFLALVYLDTEKRKILVEYQHSR